MRDVVTKIIDGRLMLYDARTGGIVKTLSSTSGKYASAVVSGAIVQAQRVDGKTDTYDTAKGRFIRTI